MTETPEAWTLANTVPHDSPSAFRAERTRTLSAGFNHPCNQGGTVVREAMRVRGLPPRHYLTPRACAGILRRALRRGKAIPEPLRSALEAQAGREWNQAMKRQEATMDKATEQATPAETGRPANGSAPATAKWAMRGLELITDNDGGSVTIRISMGGLGLPELLADLAGAGVA